MKKIMIALSLFAVSSAASAGMMNEDVSMTVVTAGQGAWVKVVQNGEPVQGATVTLSGALGEYVTPENGLVFVTTDDPFTRSAVFTAKLSNGGEVQKRVLIARDHD
ncbi:hypothetical protein K6Q96_22550 [Grimontia kaedaensis]|uniref:Uncharacterized protein n=1 Tax=Grimontia kaedaensis TaxID=2872157 RepID=A0ABY4WZT1_9GAMM|nr:hypothetical protein [Grimontia kaedaensis]USH04509.1 hypothetical protein K6Q96_22550 [Grimontia kaedaensis]